MDDSLFCMTSSFSHCLPPPLPDRTQSLLNQQGPLAECEQFQGLYRISLLSPIEPGQWHLNTIADGHVTFNAIGTPSITILHTVPVPTE